MSDKKKQTEPDFSRMSVDQVYKNFVDKYPLDEAQGRLEAYLNFRWAEGTKLHAYGEPVYVVGCWHNWTVCTAEEADGEECDCFMFCEFDEYEQVPK